MTSTFEGSEVVQEAERVPRTRTTRTSRVVGRPASLCAPPVTMAVEAMEESGRPFPPTQVRVARGVDRTPTRTVEVQVATVEVVERRTTTIRERAARAPMTAGAIIPAPHVSLWEAAPLRAGAAAPAIAETGAR